MTTEDSPDDTPMMDAEDEQRSASPATSQNGDSKPDGNGTSSKAGVELGDLFNDDDDELDDIMSSAVDTSIPSSPPAAAPVPEPSGPLVSQEIMYAFYQLLFPFRYLFQWLNHGIKPAPDFYNREFAFTLQNGRYLRYRAFRTGDLLKKEVLSLNPSRFEIGPVYSANPVDRKSISKAGSFRPVSKELVFDIDLTDYDDVRTCCKKADICSKCWTFATMSIKVMDAALRDDFGFKHILWVYSGRRGVHAWVCDKRARDLPDDRRKAVAGYLEVVRGGAQSGKRVNLKRPLHPHISRSLDILKSYFASTILEDQDLFISADSDSQSERLLALIPDKNLVAALRKKWSSSPGRPSASKWADIDSLARTSGIRNLDTKALRDAKQDIVLEYTYPRLDAEVSKKRIHLLKSPFVVHPGTGRVCVPIDISKVDEFDPMSVPTVSELLNEINEWDLKYKTADVKAAESEDDGAESQTRKRPTAAVQDYEKTSLKPYIEYFKQFVAALNRDENGVKREREDDVKQEDVEGMEF